MKNVIWLLAIVIAVAFVTQDNFAQKKFKEKGKEFREDFKKQLNLTEEQEKKIEQLRLAHQELMIKFRSDVELKELEIRKLVSSDNVTRSEMIKLTKEMNALKDEIELARVNHKMDVYDNLDVNQKNLWMEQKEKFGMMKDKMKDKCNHGRG
jgi:Spy/CpxP family protein refolding chaperone